MDKTDQNRDQVRERFFGTEAIEPTMHMADACRVIWLQQLLDMRRNEPGVRADKDVEFAHDMRVATRRARAAEQVFGDFFKKHPVRDYIRMLRKTARVLGTVRDLDVALQKLKRYRKELSGDEREQLKPLKQAWQAARAEPFAALLAWLDDESYLRFLAEFELFGRTPGAAARDYTWDAGAVPPQVQVRHVLPGRIWDRFQAVRRYEIVLDGQHEAPVETLHALRIDCKRLRYILEFAEDLLGEEAGALAEALKQLQDHLGDLNDAAVARAKLQGLPGTLQTPAVHGYIDRQTDLIEAAKASIPCTFRQFTAAENRLRLARSIACL